MQAMYDTSTFPNPDTTGSMMTNIIRMMIYIPGACAHVCDSEILGSRKGYARVEEIAGLVLPEIML